MHAHKISPANTSAFHIKTCFAPYMAPALLTTVDAARPSCRACSSWSCSSLLTASATIKSGNATIPPRQKPFHMKTRANNKNFARGKVKIRAHLAMPSVPNTSNPALKTHWCIQHLFVCVCVCVHVRERESARERETEKERMGMCGGARGSERAPERHDNNV